MDLVDKIITYETEGLDFGQTVELFQELIDSEQAWTLQGHYGRFAQILIEEGYCTTTTNTEGE